MAEEAKQEKNVIIQKIYVKDMSFETPNSPQIFQEKWDPKIDMNLNAEPKKLDENLVEVILTVTITVKIGEKTAYLCEIQQSGIFSIQGFSEQEIGPLLGIYCPNVIFPYARETVSDLVNRGGFPPMMLVPVNFEAVYAKHVQQMQQQTKN
jgi:preprotein translocase subunit SecB